LDGGAADEEVAACEAGGDGGFVGWVGAFRGEEGDEAEAGRGAFRVCDELDEGVL